MATTKQVLAALDLRISELVEYRAALAAEPNLLDVSAGRDDQDDLEGARLLGDIGNAISEIGGTLAYGGNLSPQIPVRDRLRYG